MKKHYAFLILMSLILASCSKETQLASLPVGMVSWIENNTSEGWKHVDWNSQKLAVLSSYTSQATNVEGGRVAELLNKSFMKRESDNRDPSLADYVDRGVLVHGLDSYDQNKNLFSPVQQYTATSYVQAQLNIENNLPIYHDTFQLYEKGTPSAGIVFYPISELKNPYSIFAIYAYDGATGDRYLGANTEKDVLDRGGQDFRDYVQKKWDAHESVNIAKKLDINTFNDYYNTILSRLENSLPALSSIKEDFDTFFDYSRGIVYLGNLYFKEENRIKRRLVRWGLDLKFARPLWNEFILRIPENDDYENLVAGIFYLSSQDSDYYAVPEGELKPYNVHLREAQDQQMKLWEEKKIFKSILEVKVDQLVKGKEPFFYHTEDQVINLP